MATQIGMTQESYSKIEANRNNISITKLEKIAQIGYFGEVETLKNLYDKIIEQQRSEIDFLRSLLKDKS